jgi:hypothetical protein
MSGGVMVQGQLTGDRGTVEERDSAMWVVYAWVDPRGGEVFWVDYDVVGYYRTLLPYPVAEDGEPHAERVTEVLRCGLVPHLIELGWCGDEAEAERCCAERRQALVGAR